MDKLGNMQAFRERQNIVLEGFDPVSTSGFTQLPHILLNDTSLSFAAKVAYAKLLSYAWNHNCVFPGQERMAKDMGCGQSTVSEAIGELKTHGWVEIIRRGQGRTNIYKLKFIVQKR